VRRKDDRLPERFTKEGYPDEPHKGSVVPLEELKDQFYNAMGWDIDTGVPTPEKLRELGLDYARLNG
jgi:aldehyde:ferredoxin oxidoreductase